MDRTRSSRVFIVLTGQWTCYAIITLNHFAVLTMARPPPGSNAAGKLKWAYGLLLNPRGVGSGSQKGKIPPFSSRNPNYVPSRYRFIARRLVTALITIAIFKALRVVREIYYSALEDGDYDEGKASIIRRLGTGDVSMREIYIRAWIPVNFVLTGHCILQIFHSITSALAVALGDEPRRWPPLLGDIREAYSLRRYWRHVFFLQLPSSFPFVTCSATDMSYICSSYWHSLIRAAAVSNSIFLVQSVFRIPKSSPIFRQLIGVLVFAMGGVAHVVGDWAVSPTCDHTPVMWWWLLMPLGIALEDSIMWLFSGVAAGRQWNLVGYVWVWMYLAWSLPKKIFPLSDCRAEYGTDWTIWG